MVGKRVTTLKTAFKVLPSSPGYTFQREISIPLCRKESEVGRSRVIKTQITVYRLQARSCWGQGGAGGKRDPWQKCLVISLPSLPRGTQGYSTPRQKWNEHWSGRLSDKGDSLLLAARSSLPESQRQNPLTISLQGWTMWLRLWAVCLIQSQSQSSELVLCPPIRNTGTIPPNIETSPFPENPSLPFHSFRLYFQLKYKYLWALRKLEDSLDIILS